MEFADSGAIGASGGILIMWNKDTFKPQTITTHRNLILITGTSVSSWGSGLSWVILVWGVSHILFWWLGYMGPSHFGVGT